MFKTTTVTELRADLAKFLKELEDGPVIVLSHSRPAAVLIEPELFDSIFEKLELLEDLIEGRHAIAEYLADQSVAVDAEEVFERLGH